jgi:hypothetical protein
MVVTDGLGPVPPDVRLTDRVVLGSLAFTLAANGASSLFAPGWRAASLIVAANWIALAWLIVARRNGLVLRLALLGIVAGFAELPADRWLIESARTLVYDSGGPFVLRSPLYMPFAWGVVLVQTGYVAWRLLGRFGTGLAVLLTSAAGAATIPLYEWWARGAGWGHYRDARMLGPVPYAIIFGEAVCAGFLVLWVRDVERRGWWVAAAAGVAEGAIIWGGYVVGWAVVG